MCAEISVVGTAVGTGGDAMRALSAGQYKAILDLHRDLVREGWRSDVARAIVGRAAGLTILQTQGSGLGKVQQTRRLKRDLYPGLTPRWQNPTSQCRTIPVYPGQENQMLAETQQLQAQGYSLTEVESYPGHRLIYACPSGQYPGENQPLVVQGMVL